MNERRITSPNRRAYFKSTIFFQTRSTILLHEISRRRRTVVPEITSACRGVRGLWARASSWVDRWPLSASPGLCSSASSLLQSEAKVDRPAFQSVANDQISSLPYLVSVRFEVLQLRFQLVYELELFLPLFLQQLVVLLVALLEKEKFSSDYRETKAGL